MLIIYANPYLVFARKEKCRRTLATAKNPIYI